MGNKKLKKQEKPSGRPRDSFAVVEGQEAFAAQWGYRVEVVKMAKKSGCPGFLAGNRIDPALAIPAINRLMQTKSALPEGIATPQDWLATEKAKREAIKRQQDEGAMMPTADAIRQAGEAMGLTFAELERRDRELPPALAGLPAVEIHKRMTGDTESIRKTLKAKFQEVGK